MPTPSFTDLGVPAAIAERLAQLDRPEPFAIQVDAIPSAMAGRDVAGCAPTGSGKTLAFSIPVAATITAADPHLPRALIMTPTRELAGQIRDAIQPLLKVRGRSVATFYGGTNIKRDQQRLKRGVDVAVATPGRLEDLVQRGDMSLKHIDVVVLDEADRMADMGFLPVVTKLLDQTPEHRQTLLFSATLDGDVDVLVRRYQRDPIRHEVQVDQADIGDVRHVFWEVTRENRRPVMIDALRDAGTTIVFTRTKHGADRLSKQLRKAGISSAAIHGNRNQNQRERALAQFGDGSVRTLVATDVAARGIHVDDVDTVIHYDLPATDKDYVHRSGRTGRAGNDGTVITFVMQDQRGDLESIQRALRLPLGTTPVDTSLENLGDAVSLQPQNQSGNGSTKQATKQTTRSATKQRSGQRSGNGRPQGGARSRNRRRR